MCSEYVIVANYEALFANTWNHSMETCTIKKSIAIRKPAIKIELGDLSRSVSFTISFFG